ncbi:MAG: DNA/RNA nuclease SfsA [Clostridia bacterium]|nr:DNA/RNA nuclease SfsA [Clostridia bacterium]
MKYNNVQFARFLTRENRFVAQVELENGARETVHVKNTGRCAELLVPGYTMAITDAWTHGRKTRFDLVAAQKPGLGWVNIDSQAPNIAMGEWLGAQGYDRIKPEARLGSSRIDFYLERDGRPTWMEVKGCTLELEGVGYFPDAPTERGRKHLLELMEVAKTAGAVIAFVIPMPGVREVRANRNTDPKFAEALDLVSQAGVEIRFYPCRVEPAGFEIIEEITWKPKER